MRYAPACLLWFWVVKTVHGWALTLKFLMHHLWNFLCTICEIFDAAMLHWMLGKMIRSFEISLEIIVVDDRMLGAEFDSIIVWLQDGFHVAPMHLPLLGTKLQLQIKDGFIKFFNISENEKCVHTALSYCSFQTKQYFSCFNSAVNLSASIVTALPLIS